MANTDEAYDRSVELLARAGTEHGFVASPAFDHYAVIWARDAAISSLGALVSRDSGLIETAIRSMQTMGSAATPLGQIPAVIRPSLGNHDWGDGGVVDATAWYVILAGAILASTEDTNDVGREWPRIRKAISWLRHQDVTGSGLLSSPPATDWMDGSLTRSGRTLNINVLYHWAAAAASAVGSALDDPVDFGEAEIARRINILFWPSAEQGPETLLQGSGMGTPPPMFPHPATVDAHAAASRVERTHYVSHVIHSEYDEHCDVLANLIALSTGVARDDRATRIVGYLDEAQVADPYPTRVWDRPVQPDEPSSMFHPGVETHLHPRWRNPPYSYHNGAVWPFVGGFHATALALLGETKPAAELLAALADANQVGDWSFSEWLHGRSGEPGGAPQQTWNAGAYVLAQRALDDATEVRPIFEPSPS